MEQFLKLTPTGEFNLDYISDDGPQYLDVAQFSCPEGHVFEVYDQLPDENGSYPITPDVTTVNLTCADYGDWLPLQVPFCIKLNCTESPVLPPNNTKGIFDWDMKTKTFNHAVTYSCPTPGWGYPSNGLSTMNSTCQADKMWSITSIEDCICKSIYLQ